MQPKEMLKRYGLLLIGLFVVAFGVALVTKASLGTSPIASLPYCISLILPFMTFGKWLIMYCFLLIFLQIIMLGKACNKFELLVQMAISLTFGYCTDFFMHILQGFTPENYGIKLASLILGCTVMALGAALEVTADVAMLPIDAIEQLVAKKLSQEYAKIRLIADISMVILSAILCLIFLGELAAVREGTVIVALLTGNIVKIIVKKLKPLSECLH